MESSTGTVSEGVGDWVRRRAVKSRGFPAIVFRDVETPYEVLADRIDALAAGLSRLGVARGDRVAYLGDNHPAFLESLFAVLRIGGVFVPLNTRLSVPELEFQLEDSGAEILISALALEERAAAAASGRRIRRIVVGDPDAPVPTAADADALDYESLAAADPDGELAPPVLRHDDPAVILYTSGTTGRPKGAVLTHGNLTWNSINTIVDYDVTSRTRQLLISPLFHVAAFSMGALPTILKGGALLVQERFVPAQALRAIERLRATHIAGVPTTYQMMMEDPAWATTDISSLVSMTCGGSAVPERVIAAYAERGLAFSGGYGMTETSPGIVSMPPWHAADHVGASGLAHFFSAFRIRSAETGDLAAPGERGEIETAGPNVIAEYWNRPDATAESFTEDGWFRTGDIGVADEDGFLSIVDRAKDMIISGGENIYSAEVELELAALDGVTGAAVIGVPHERWGEVPHAIVTLAPGRTLTAEEMVEALSARLARYKVPRTLDIVDELPRTASGKVQKAALRAAHGRRAAEA